MKINREIRASRVRVVNQHGEQLGVLTLAEALTTAENDGLDLVEISPTSDPPVCKIVDYGRFRYQQTKRERTQKKGVIQTKIKELKVKPTTDDHDLEVKERHAREFLIKRWKVRVVCVFRGREVHHPEIGIAVLKQISEALADIAVLEAEPKMTGRMLSIMLVPSEKKKAEEKRVKSVPGAPPSVGA